MVSKTAYVLPASDSRARLAATRDRAQLATGGFLGQQAVADRSRAPGIPRRVFNLFNHANFGQPDGNISNVTAGVISTADDARNIQFGMRVAW